MSSNDADRDRGARGAEQVPGTDTGSHVVVVFNEKMAGDQLEQLFDVTFNTSDENARETIASLPKVLPWEDIVGNFPDLTFSRVFASLSLDDLRVLQKRADFINADDIDADDTFNSPVAPSALAFYRIDPTRSADNVDDDLQRVVDFLVESSGFVERAYVASQVSEPPIFRGRPVIYEGFFELPADGGIGIRLIQHKYRGATGWNTRFVDIEQGWTLRHPDLPTISHPSPLIGENRPGENYRLHGLMVLGLLVANDDGKGVTGIAPQAQAYIASEVRRNSQGKWVGITANAIAAAASKLRPGDVILIEGQQWFTPQYTNQPVGVNMPVEADPAIFAAIQLATSSGVIVVEPTGNNTTGLDLDMPILTNGNPQVFTAGDSGAIVVAAGTNLIDKKTFTRRVTTNYSKRVNCFADGDWLWVLDEIGLSEPQPLYYELIEGGGTSSAAAIIAGTALVLQSIARHNGGIITPRKMRKILGDTTTGTMPAGLNPRIGVMPNLIATESTYGSLANVHALRLP